jgi:hypothetical protein
MPLFVFFVKPFFAFFAKKYEFFPNYLISASIKYYRQSWGANIPQRLPARAEGGFS